MDTQVSIVDKSEAHAKSFYQLEESKRLTYHNWKHTEQVIKTVQVIGASENLDEEKLENLHVAAIFHDVAYFQGKEGHEEKSAEIAREFLTKNGVDPGRVQEIERIILATKMGSQPNDLLEQIIQDADLSHLGNKDYIHTTFKDLLKEINTVCPQAIKMEEWESMCVEFMNKHQFHTNYAKANFEAQKQENIHTLIAMIEQAKEQGKDSMEVVMEAGPSNTDEEKKPKKKKKKSAKKKEDIPEKGIETMFRVALRNHVNLSRIADNKANTLISVNAIIISIVLSTMFPKMDTNPYIIYPGLALIIFSIVTIIISILSTIPKTTHGKLSRKEVENRQGNLIFFGNFHKMSLEDYEWGVSELMKDRDYLYKSLTRDLYFLGKVLNRKYTLLRYSYYTFVIGLVVSIALFAISLQGVVQ